MSGRNRKIFKKSLNCKLEVVPVFAAPITPLMPVPPTVGLANCCVPMVPMVLAAPGAEKVEAELLQLGAVNFGEFDLQQNLAFVQRLPPAGS